MIRLVQCAVAGAVVLGATAWVAAASVFQPTGIKIGEVTGASAVVWTRLASVTAPRHGGLQFVDVKRREAEAADPMAQLPPGAALKDMEGSVPGAEGEVRVVWRRLDERSPARSTAWTRTSPAADFTAQIRLTDLAPGVRYAVTVESRDLSGQPGETVEGRFVTPFAADQSAPVRFIITTCHDDERRDDEAGGFRMYGSARQWAPDFFVHTGDFVYLDKPRPYGLTPALARFKWNRTSAWPTVREFYRGVSAYFIKDDHDISRNDSAPGDQFGALTFSEGVRIGAEQLPMPPAPGYRSVRWGRDLEIWLLESREHRNARKGEKVADRTLLGADQKQWLFDSLRRSTATFRVVISGVPIVGPNVDYKSGEGGDSLADDVFRSEGEEVRRRLAAIPNTLVVAGDRHWQYHSIDPETGLNEFGCGPACFGMAAEFVTKVKRTPLHQFLRIDGGFLSGEVRETGTSPPTLTLRHHDVNGEIVYESTFAARPH